MSFADLLIVFALIKFDQQNIICRFADDFFIKMKDLGALLNFNEPPSVRRESDYASRIKRHYSLFKDYMMNKAIGTNGSKAGRNEACPCGSGSKYKKCCASTR